jgi:hypothetical protein
MFNIDNRSQTVDPDGRVRVLFKVSSADARDQLIHRREGIRDCLLDVRKGVFLGCVGRQENSICPNLKSENGDPQLHLMIPAILVLIAELVQAVYSREADNHLLFVGPSSI